MRRQVKRLEKSLGGRGKAFSFLGRHLLQERESRNNATQAAQNPPQFRHRGRENQPPQGAGICNKGCFSFHQRLLFISPNVAFHFTKRCFSFHQMLLFEALHLIIK